MLELYSSIKEAHPQGETYYISRENTDAESYNPDSSSNKLRPAIQEAISRAGRRTNEMDYVRVESYLPESATSGALLDGEEDVHKEEGGDRFLAAAVWCCREIYVSRCRGIIARLGVAASRCETVAASTKAALRCLNRRRVQLEHGTVTSTTLAVRRALEEYDHVAIREILENDIPVRRCYTHQYRLIIREGQGRGSVYFTQAFQQRSLRSCRNEIAAVNYTRFPPPAALLFYW